jgi:hypothetical protein
MKENKRVAKESDNNDRVAKAQKRSKTEFCLRVAQN